MEESRKKKSLFGKLASKLTRSSVSLKPPAASSNSSRLTDLDASTTSIHTNASQFIDQTHSAALDAKSGDTRSVKSHRTGKSAKTSLGKGKKARHGFSIVSMFSTSSKVESLDTSQADLGQSQQSQPNQPSPDTLKSTASSRNDVAADINTSAVSIDKSPSLGDSRAPSYLMLKDRETAMDNIEEVASASEANTSTRSIYLGSEYSIRNFKPSESLGNASVAAAIYQDGNATASTSNLGSQAHLQQQGVDAASAIASTQVSSTDSVQQNIAEESVRTSTEQNLPRPTASVSEELRKEAESSQNKDISVQVEASQQQEQPLGRISEVQKPAPLTITNNKEGPDTSATLNGMRSRAESTPKQAELSADDLLAKLRAAVGSRLSHTPSQHTLLTLRSAMSFNEDVNAYRSRSTTWTKNHGFVPASATTQSSLASQTPSLSTPKVSSSGSNSTDMMQDPAAKSSTSNGAVNEGQSLVFGARSLSRASSKSAFDFSRMSQASMASTGPHVSWVPDVNHGMSQSPLQQHMFPSNTPITTTSMQQQPGGSSIPPPRSPFAPKVDVTPQRGASKRDGKPFLPRPYSNSVSGGTRPLLNRPRNISNASAMTGSTGSTGIGPSFVAAPDLSIVYDASNSSTTRLESEPVALFQPGDDSRTGNQGAVHQPVFRLALETIASVSPSESITSLGQASTEPSKHVSNISETDEDPRDRNSVASQHVDVPVVPATERPNSNIDTEEKPKEHQHTLKKPGNVLSRKQTSKQLSQILDTSLHPPSVLTQSPSESSMVVELPATSTVPPDEIDEQMDPVFVRCIARSGSGLCVLEPGWDTQGFEDTRYNVWRKCVFDVIRHQNDCTLLLPPGLLSLLEDDFLD